MVADPTASEPRSRLFTILGWACILIAGYSLYHSTVNHLNTIRVLNASILERHRVVAHARFAVLHILSLVAIWGGFGMWKRRSWAPLMMSAVAGANFGSSGWWLVQASPYILESIRDDLDTRPMMALMRGFSFLSLIVELIVWLAVLGALFRENGRREFPPTDPPFTTTAFCVSAGAGMAAVVAIFGFLKSVPLS